MGRPTDYTPEIVERARQYLTEHMLEERKENALPSVAGLARYLDVARSSIYEWAKEHTEFSDILEQVLSEQEMKLFYFGLNNKWNASIVKLALGKHGYTDKQDITTDGKALPSPILGSVTKEDVQEDNSSQ